MKTNLRYAFAATGFLSLILPSSFALPIDKERTQILVSGDAAEILTTTVNVGTIDTLSVRDERYQPLSKRDATWTIEAGDTGNGIAARLSIQFTQLALLNQGIDWNNLQVGQVLTIPFSEDPLSNGTDVNANSTFYTVVAGDTGDEIAANYSLSFDQLQALNPEVDWYNLQIGQTILLPSQQMAVSTQGQATGTQGEEQNANTPASTSQVSSTSMTTSATSSTTTTKFASNFDSPFLDTPSRMVLRPRAGSASVQTGTAAAVKAISTITIPTPLPTTGSSTITVQVGDTAAAIASRSGISLASLAVANSAVDLSNLKPGQILRLPSVKAGGLVYDQATAVSSTVLSVSTTKIARLGASTSITSTTHLSTSLSKQMTVTVISGDTFLSIATTYGVSVSDLANVNFGIDVQNLEIGQILNLPTDARTPVTSATKLYSTKTTKISPITNVTSIAQAQLGTSSNSQTYTVKAGDTGYSIAAALGIAFSDLSKVNPGVVWTNLQIGQVLNLPTSTTVSMSTTVATAPSTSTSSNVLNRKSGTDIYLTYSGPPSNLSYPSISTWMSFGDLWNANSKFIGASCSFASGTVAPNTASENAALQSSILSVSAETGVNPSFILALVMQESNGCVRAPTTSSYEGIHNPGLLQSYNGNGTCDSNGQPLQPCPDSMIKLMLLNGIAGVQGVGIVPALKQAAMEFGLTWTPDQSQSTSPSTSLNATTTANASTQATASSKQKNINANAHVQSGARKRTTQMLTSNLDEGLFYYMAARIYNSGSLPANLDLSAPTGSTQCYVSDVVNRLEGWVTAPYNCTLNSSDRLKFL